MERITAVLAANVQQLKKVEGESPDQITKEMKIIHRARFKASQKRKII
jgi:hypothetical protein